MDTKTPNLEIRFRTYRHSDAEAVRELFKDSITVGGTAHSLHLTLLSRQSLTTTSHDHPGDSPMMVALHAQFTTPSAIALYTMTALGAFLAAWSPTTRIRYLGFFFCFLGTATFSFLIYTRFTSYGYFVEHAMTTDLKDVPKTYGLTLARETGKGEYVANGPNGFWVAEVYHAEGMYPEIVGCAGLGGFSPRPESKMANASNPFPQIQAKQTPKIMLLNFVAWSSHLNTEDAGSRAVLLTSPLPMR